MKLNMEIPGNVLDEMVQRKLEGESYSQIRKELSDSGLRGDELRSAMRKIDEKVLEEELNRKAGDRTKQWYRAGMFLALVGLLLTLGASRGIILNNIPRWILYTPFFGGIALMLYSRFAGKRSDSSRNDGPGPIRRKRPFK